VLSFLGYFSLLWWLWASHTYYADRYDTDDLVYRLIAACQMVSFDIGEGWTGATVRDGQTRDYTLSGMTNLVSGGIVPTLELLLVGRFTGVHPVDIWVGSSVSSLRLHSSQSLSEFETKKINLDLLFTDIGSDGNFVVRVVPSATGPGANILSVSYIKLTANQQTNATSQAEKFFLLHENPGAKSYIEIANAPTNARLYDVTDRAHPVSIRTTLTTTLNAVVPNTTAARRLLLTNITIVSVIILLLFYRFYRTAMLDIVDKITANNWNLGLFMLVILVVPVILLIF
jgi:hypothetical protein